ncbi:hypothetical protein MK805_15485 [Shimazuella sp. AN120528]|uniref:hypothetical protein n=1 Tax=Shimazuella soli TaxID=1892854 RepID=UPI001F10E401|nr:hypothetical protein [Shimazuella soli]MCH5586345.1 hypothetical protein [Shimazuella soli]
MNQWELIILMPNCEEKYLNPTWEQIKKHLEYVDGDHLDNLVLTNPSIGEMIVCGGNKIRGKSLYGVSCFPTSGNGYIEYNLLNPEVKTRDEEFEEITTQGVGVHHNKEFLVEFDDMLKAFEVFYRTGKLSEQDWF